MKYSKTNPPLQCYMTQSTWYKGAGTVPVRGILWHSTGANSPMIRRYVQPDDKAENRNELLSIIGKNIGGSDWNHTAQNCGVHAFIGKLADNSVATVQVGPWNKKAWGCGSGSKGSCNNGWIQFEICEDGLNDPAYFNAVYKEACELTAYLCTIYGLDPMGTVRYANMDVPVILCHADSHKLGLGSNHADVLHWLPKYGKSMDTVRADVKKLMQGSAPATSAPALPTDVKNAINSLAKKGYIDSPDYWIKACSKMGNLKYLFTKSDKKLVGLEKKASSVEEGLKNLVAIGIVDSSDYWLEHQNDVKYLPDLLMQLGGKQIDPKAKFPYQVKVTAGALNYRNGPSTNYKICGIIRFGEVYTIIDESNGWGKLKSGSGWICLDYVKKI